MKGYFDFRNIGVYEGNDGHLYLNERIKMKRLLCMCCEAGDIRNGVICETCDDKIQQRKHVYEDMIILVMNSNNIQNIKSDEKLKDEIHEKVRTIYELLCDIKIEKN